MCPKYGDKNLSEKLPAEMEFCKIDPWKALLLILYKNLFRLIIDVYWQNIVVAILYIFRSRNLFDPKLI
jgi:hypothetical protein